jgi:hypothetical protein
MKLIGKGVAFDATNAFQFLDCGDVMLTFGSETLEVNKGDVAGKDIIPLGLPISGRINWTNITAAAIAGILGLTPGAGGLERTTGETGTVPPAPGPYTIVLGNPPVDYTEEIFYADNDGLCPCGTQFKRVAAVSGTAGEYEINYTTGVVTFDGVDEGTNVIINYIWDNAVGEQISLCLDPNTLPDGFRLIATLACWDPIAMAYAADMVFDLQRCVRTGDFGLGATVKAAGTFGFDFAVVNNCAADVCVYMPEDACNYVPV